MISFACFRAVASAATLNLASVLIVTSVALADQQCDHVDAYWNTNLSNLKKNLSECDTQRWQKCSQAAAIHYDLNAGSLHQRAQACGLAKPLTPGIDFTGYQETDSAECMQDRDALREAYEIRAQARIACAAARAGGNNQEQLDSQCALYRSQMENYHTPFRNMAQSCGINYSELLALR